MGSLIIWFFSEPIVRIFNTEPDLALVTTDFMRIQIVGFLVFGFVIVLAAWGLPNMRSEVSKNGSETWTYFAIDETSREVHGYQLVFDKNRLCHWVISDHPGQGILNPEDLTGLPTVGDTQTLPSGMGLEQKR